MSDYIWKDHASKPGVSSCDLPRQDESPDSAATWRGGTTVSVSVYTVHLSGFQELYRHFLRLPDGAIVEVGPSRLLTCRFLKAEARASEVGRRQNRKIDLP